MEVIFDVVDEEEACCVGGGCCGEPGETVTGAPILCSVLSGFGDVVGVDDEGVFVCDDDAAAAAANTAALR